MLHAVRPSLEQAEIVPMQVGMLVSDGFIASVDTIFLSLPQQYIGMRRELRLWRYHF